MRSERCFGSVRRLGSFHIGRQLCRHRLGSIRSYKHKRTLSECEWHNFGNELWRVSKREYLLFVFFFGFDVDLDPFIDLDPLLEGAFLDPFRDIAFRDVAFRSIAFRAIALDPFTAFLAWVFCWSLASNSSTEEHPFAFKICLIVGDSSSIWAVDALEVALEVASEVVVAINVGLTVVAVKLRWAFRSFWLNGRGCE